MKKSSLLVATAGGILTTVAIALASGFGMTNDPPKDSHGSQPAAKTPAKPVAKPAEKAAEKPSDKAPEKHGEKPADKSEAAVEPKPKPRATLKDITTAEDAMAALQEGNARWVSGQPISPNIEPSRRALVADKGQKPFVTVLTCADSRLPVERIFDRGVGEVFVVRVAGNIAGNSETGTIEYGLGHLNTPLLVVMGHTKCGAVAAAASGAQLHGALGKLVATISPAVDRAKRNNPGADGNELAAFAIRENVWQSVFDLYKSPEIRGLVTQGKVKVVGAVCDISTGKVDWLGEHPWQSELMDALTKREAGEKSPVAEASEHDDHAAPAEPAGHAAPAGHGGH